MLQRQQHPAAQAANEAVIQAGMNPAATCYGSAISLANRPPQLTTDTDVDSWLFKFTMYAEYFKEPAENWGVAAVSYLSEEALQQFMVQYRSLGYQTFLDMTWEKFKETLYRCGFRSPCTRLQTLRAILNKDQQATNTPTMEFVQQMQQLFQQRERYVNLSEAEKTDLLLCSLHPIIVQDAELDHSGREWQHFQRLVDHLCSRASQYDELIANRGPGAWSVVHQARGFRTLPTAMPTAAGHEVQNEYAQPHHAHQLEWHIGAHPDWTPAPEGGPEYDAPGTSLYDHMGRFIATPVSTTTSQSQQSSSWSTAPVTPSNECHEWIGMAASDLPLACYGSAINSESWNDVSPDPPMQLTASDYDEEATEGADATPTTPAAPSNLSASAPAESNDQAGSAWGNVDRTSALMTGLADASTANEKGDADWQTASNKKGKASQGQASLQHPKRLRVVISATVEMPVQEVMEALREQLKQYLVHDVGYPTPAYGTSTSYTVIVLYTGKAFEPSAKKGIQLMVGEVKSTVKIDPLLKRGDDGDIRLCIRNMHPQTSKDEIVQLMTNYGNVISEPYNDAKEKGCAFVSLVAKSMHHVLDLIQPRQGLRLHGKEVKVEIAGVEEDGGWRLHLGKVPANVSKDAIKSYMMQFGEVMDVDIVTTKNPPLCYVTLSPWEDDTAEAILVQGHKIGSWRFKIEPADSRGTAKKADKPPSIVKLSGLPRMATNAQIQAFVSKFGALQGKVLNFAGTTQSCIVWMVPKSHEKKSDLLQPESKHMIDGHRVTARLIRQAHRV